ncbi:hypothetical protein [Alistipes timonensis]
MKKFYWSRLRVLTWAVLFTAGGFASCSDDEKEPTPPPPAELKDQIRYGDGQPVDVKSAIFDVEDTDLYTFYLSPTPGIKDLAGMSAAKDCLSVVVRNPKGTVNTASDTFEIAYKDISVKKQTMNDVEKVQLSADLVAETQRLNLYVEVTLKSGKTLLARYNNTCTEAVPQKLDNQFELDKAIAAIGSVVEWRNPVGGSTTWHFYTQSDVTAPSDAMPAGMQITVADGTETANIDLSKADPEKIKVICGKFQTGEGATGALSLSKNADGTELTVEIDARKGGSSLRTAYTGAFASGYDSSDKIKVTEGGTPEEAGLKRVFGYKESLTNNFAFGVADAEAPAGLMEGHYAMQLGLSDSNIGKTIDLATESSKCTFALYDYQTYKTYDISKTAGVTGTVTTAGTARRLYLRFSVTIPDGPAVEGEWFGDVTAAEAVDLTPVKPFSPHITITKADGEVKMEKDILSMEMRLEKNYRLRGGDPQYGGATFDAYFFYLRPEGSSEPIDDKFSTYVYPILMIPASYIPSTDLKLIEGGDDLHWNFQFMNNENLLQNASSGYSEKYTMYGSTSGYCPDDAMVTVVRNADKTWKITFTMTESGSLPDYAGKPQAWGYGNKLVVEWEGPATKYSGTKKNDLTDADY